MRKLICALLTLTVFFACAEKDLKENLKKEVYSNWIGTDIPKIIHFIDTLSPDKPVIAEQLCYEDGKVHYEKCFKNGNLDGKWTTFYQDGTKQAVYNFKDGERHGDHIIYFENGKVKSKGTYKNGKQVGVWKTYDENGKLKKKENFDKK